LVTEAVRLEIARDKRISLAKGSSEAAGRLEIHLTRFDRSAKAPRADDTALTRKYAQTLTAEITLLDHNGKVLIDHQQVAVTRDVFTDSGQQPAEYQNMPVLAQALATEIAHRLLDRW
jgi:outer membrane lipopolysaccharide assembly protein LptE/RlpB